MGAIFFFSERVTVELWRPTPSPPPLSNTPKHPVLPFSDLVDVSFQKAVFPALSFFFPRSLDGRNRRKPSTDIIHGISGSLHFPVRSSRFPWYRKAWKRPQSVRRPKQKTKQKTRSRFATLWVSQIPVGRSWQTNRHVVPARTHLTRDRLRRIARLCRSCLSFGKATPIFPDWLLIFRAQSSVRVYIRAKNESLITSNISHEKRYH